ncbi:MAG: methyltransferase domain-containing protein [Egibacteraceae bacterium]
MSGWSRAQVRHLARMARFAPNPVPTIYDSLGDAFFLAPAPGWLNLGLWEGSGDEAEAAGALPVVGDATRLPLGHATVDGVISVEAALHFSSRHAFLAEGRRVRLRPEMLRWARRRVRTAGGAPPTQRAAAAVMLSQWSLLRRRGVLEYVIVTARCAPPARSP